MDFRHYLQTHLPQRTAVSSKGWSKWAGRYLNDPKLWHLGRRGVARATGFGMLVAFCPIPVHLLIIVPLALCLRLNLPVLLAVVWVNNPLTIVPMFYFAYRVGLALTGHSHASQAALVLSGNWHHIRQALAAIWWPLCVGSAICGVVAGLLAFVVIKALWRVSIVRRWRARHGRVRPG